MITIDIIRQITSGSPRPHLRMLHRCRFQLSGPGSSQVARLPFQPRKLRLTLRRCWGCSDPIRDMGSKSRPYRYINGRVIVDYCHLYCYYPHYAISTHSLLCIFWSTYHHHHRCEKQFCDSGVIFPRRVFSKCVKWFTTIHSSHPPD
jgi:hypothetical protein